ncbi:MAG: MoaD/ThiS family protein [Myxococcota bacterium]|nr:MoaD/ThiS family protein [Myxococcota bacterium]
MPVVEVPSRYRVPTRGEARIEVDGATVRECIVAVESRYPGFQELIIDAQGGQRRFVRIFLNGELHSAQALDTAVDSGDTITVMASAAGG